MAVDESYNLGDTLHRLVKQSLDNGMCKSIAEADELFRRYRIHIEISPADAASPQHQAALLTVIALSRRVFLGGVTCDDIGDVELLLAMPLGGTVKDAIVALGGLIAPADSSTPTISIGNSPRPRRERFHIRTIYAGWRAGIIPAHSDSKLGDKTAIPVACSLAAALAVNEAYRFVSDGATIAGKRLIGMSLWNVLPESNWLDPSDEPELAYLPSQLWLIGLGHLGQAYLWTLGLLPYPEPSNCTVVLQDVDAATPSTESTSILTDKSLVGKMKTRSMASWCEQRGFRASIYERRFNNSFKRQASEPAVALCGIDNAIGRSALDEVGFDLIVEAGLGRGHRDFRTMRLHTLPGTRKASDIWGKCSADTLDVAGNEAYQRLLREGTVDQCGLTLLAGKAVGAPFVGAAAAALAIAEVLRLLHGGRLYQLVDADLLAVEHRTVVPHPSDFSKLNPGFVRVG